MNSQYKLVCMYIGNKIVLDSKFDVKLIFEIHRKHDKLTFTDFLISISLEIRNHTGR